MEESTFLQSLLSAWDETGEEGEDPYADETGSRQFNALIRAARMFLDDRATPTEFFDELRIVAHRLALALRHHDRIRRSPAASDEARALAERTGGAYEQIRRALVDMADYFQTRDSEKVLEGIERLKEASENLSELNHDFDSIDDSYGQVACLMCGQANPEDEGHCVRCGSILPDEAPPEGQGLAAAPTEVLGFFAACDQVAGGGFPLEYWHSMGMSLLETVRDLHSHAIALVEAITPYATEGLVEAGVNLAGCLEEAHGAVEAILAFEHHGDPAELARGGAALLKALERTRTAGALFWDPADSLAAQVLEEGEE